jgi:peroxiredoxin
MKLKIRALFAFIAAAAIAAPVTAAVSVGDKAPDFTLTDLNGVEHSLSNFRGQYVVLEFTNPGCPFVVKFYKPGAMQKLQREVVEMGAVWLVVNPTVANHNDYLNHEQSKEWVAEHKIPAPWMINSDSSVAKQYGAARTPEMFVINPEGKIIYMGAIDSISSANAADIERADNYVMKALKEAKSGVEVTTTRTRPYGCTIKF